MFNGIDAGTGWQFCKLSSQRASIVEQHLFEQFENSERFGIDSICGVGHSVQTTRLLDCTRRRLLPITLLYQKPLNGLYFEILIMIQVVEHRKGA